MTRAVLLQFIALFVSTFNLLLLIRVVMSWVAPGSTNSFVRLIYDLTEPVLAPVRKLLPGSGMIDLSPLVTFFLLQGLQLLAFRLLG